MILREACEWPLIRIEATRSGTERQILTMLTACALVCKYWLPLARRLLYHSVIVETGRAYDSRNVGTCGPKALLQQSHLLAFTRSLSIDVHGKSTASIPLFPEDSSLKRRHKRVRIPHYLFLLAHTPQLRWLKLSVSSAGKTIGRFEPHIQNWLSYLVLPIEVLDLWCSDLDSTFVYDLAGIWPTIRALLLYAGENKIGLPPERPSINLRELNFRSRASSATGIKWFLPPPPPNEQSKLRFLTLHYIPEDARAVLSVHGPSVSTLTLVLQPTFEIDHLFTKLEELVIKGPSWGRPLPALPRTLRHIRLDYASSADCLVLAVAQVVPMLPDLRLISIEKEFTANKHYPDLQKACEIHRVEILVILPNSSRRKSVVSVYQRFQLVCDVCHSLTTARSIHITQRWIVFLDSTRSPSSSTLWIEVIHKIFGSLGGRRGIN